MSDITPFSSPDREWVGQARLDESRLCQVSELVVRIQDFIDVLRSFRGERIEDLAVHLEAFLPEVCEEDDSVGKKISRMYRNFIFFTYSSGTSSTKSYRIAAFFF